jgi:hypothetical protein
VETEEQNKQRRHQRSAADAGQAYNEAHAESGRARRWRSMADGRVGSKLRPPKGGMCHRLSWDDSPNLATRDRVAALALGVLRVP